MAAKKQIVLLNSQIITATGAAAAALNDNGGYNRWAAYLSVGTITGTSPTLDVLIQQSFDAVNWVTLYTFTQLTGASGSTVQQGFAGTDSFYNRPLMNYLRASYTIGGSNTPTFNGLTVRLHLDK